jgi:hypothetical protein
MMIGDRLRVMREGKNISQGEVEKRTGLLRCYISRVEKTDTRFLPSKRSRSSRGRWRCRSTSSSMTVKKRHLNFQFFPGERRKPARRGAIPGKMRALCSGFGDFSAA